MEQDIFLLDSPAIERAVMAHNTEVTRRRRFGKSSLNEIPEVSAAGAAVADGYTGTFKLRWIKERTFELYYGAYPEITSNANSSIAGNTDLPGAEKVPRQFVYLPEGVKDAEVLLCACCNDGVYSTFVLVRNNDIHPDSTPVPAGYFASYEIGTIREVGDIYQSFTASGTIYFRRDWFL